MKKRILIVDDEPEIREQLKSLFEKTYPDQLNIDQAEDGVKALESIHRHTYNCIITDLHMPNMTGIELIRNLRKGKKNHKCPVVVLSGNPTDSLIKEFSYLIMLSKPFNRKNFLEIFDNQLRLGSNSNRISGAILNSFVSEISKYIEKKTKTKAEYSKLSSKTEEVVPHDLCIRAEVSINNTRNTYVLGIDSELANKLRHKLFIKKVKENDLALTLFSNARDQLHTTHGFKGLKFTNIRVLHKEQARQCLKETTGIMIRISFEVDNIHIIATSQVG